MIALSIDYIVELNRQEYAGEANIQNKVVIHSAGADTFKYPGDDAIKLELTDNKLSMFFFGKAKRLNSFTYSRVSKMLKSNHRIRFFKFVYYCLKMEFRSNILILNKKNRD